MKTFLPLNDSGRVKVLRYQVRPPHWFCSPRWPGRDQSSNVSVSLYVCGAETTVQSWSSKSGAAAPPGGSARTNFQSGLKLRMRRSPARAGKAASVKIRKARGGRKREEWDMAEKSNHARFFGATRKRIIHTAARSGKGKGLTLRQDDAGVMHRDSQSSPSLSDLYALEMSYERTNGFAGNGTGTAACALALDRTRIIGTGCADCGDSGGGPDLSGHRHCSRRSTVSAAWKARRYRWLSFAHQYNRRRRTDRDPRCGTGRLFDQLVSGSARGGEICPGLFLRSRRHRMERAKPVSTD